MRFLHLSDPHFGTVLPEVKTALLKSIADLNPEFVVFSGDISQRARRDQFREAKYFFDTLNRPYIVIPGNHDIPLFNILARVFTPYHQFVHVAGGTLQTEYRVGDFQFIGLNSSTPWRHVQGQFDRDKLRKALQTPTPAKWRIVTFHHPLDCRRPSDEENLLKNADEVVEILSDAKVDLVLSGHIHDPLIRLSTDRYPSSHPFIIAVAGTCLSWRIRADVSNSFYCIDLSDTEPRMRIERFDIDPSYKFKPIEEHVFQKASTWMRI